MRSVGFWVSAARPKTLFAAMAPVLIGAALAYRAGVFFAPAALLAFVSAVLIQIGTNFYNDYADFRGGVDANDRKGPTRAVQSGQITASAMKWASVFVFGLAVAAGGYLMWRGGWRIVGIGMLSILFGFLYTAGKYSLSSLGIADFFVFLFFGPVAVAGTYYVQALDWPLWVWITGVAPGMLSVAILLVNNIRDIEEDRLAHKKTIVVRLGRDFGVLAYAVCVAVAALVPPLVVLLYGAPVTTMAASVALLAAIPDFRTLRTRSPENIGVLNSVLASTARNLFFFSILYASAWAVAR